MIRAAWNNRPAVQFIPNLTDGFQLNIEPEDRPHRLGFFGVDHKTMIADVVAKRYRAPHPRRQRAMLMIMEPGDRVPKEHPLRRVKELADAALTQLSPLFDEIYSEIGRPSIPPERLLKASLLMALYTVRSERMFCEQLDYNLLFRLSLLKTYLNLLESEVWPEQLAAAWVRGVRSNTKRRDEIWRVSALTQRV